jgi:hypothetical protein
MGEVGTTAEVPFYALGSWPRRQVARGVWRTRGGDGLRLSVTEGSFQNSMASTDSVILIPFYS